MIKNRESEEMYLETILLLHNTKSIVRSVDVCEALGYVKSSVSRGVNLLEQKGYIKIDRETGNLVFTKAGKEKAENVYERHQTLTKTLIKLGANPELAEENACRIDHVVSEDLMKVFREFIKE